MIDELTAALRATSGPEILSVLLGVAYLVLAVRRSRWCWVAGGISTAILAVLALRAHLPMQSALNVYYVAMAVYGFQHWSAPGDAAPRISIWPARWHLIACAAIVVLSIATARFLARETQAAWPYLDSLTTWASLFTTWLVARMKLENWVYWLLIDAAQVFLYAAQRLYLIALLNAVYVVLAVAGFVSWRRTYQAELVRS